MDRRAFLRTGSSITTVGLVAGCLDLGGSTGSSGGSSGDGESDGTSSASTGGGESGPIKIGALEPKSGNFAPWGAAHLAGLRFAVEEINADGGVDGQQLELVVEDTKSDATEANNIYRRLAEQEDIVAATGPVSSDVGIRTAKTAEELQVPNLLHMAGSDKVLTEDSRYTFRVGLQPAPTVMRAQGQMVADAGYQNVGAIIADYAWGKAIKQGIQEHFPVDVTMETAPLGTSDFKPFIRKMPENLEIMVASGHPPGTFTIAKQQFSLGYSPEVTTGPSIPPGTIFGAMGEAATKGMTHVHLTDVYSDEFQSVASRFAEATGKRMDTHEGYGYVTGQLIAEAVRSAGTTEPPAIADAIRNVKLDTIFANPIQYTKWGELKDQKQIYSQFEADAPSYYGDGKWKLTEKFRTDPLEAYVPSG